MSAETYAALEEAVRQHMHDVMGTYLTDWRLTAPGAGDDAESTYYMHAGSDTALHAHLGLLQMAKRYLLSDDD